MITIKYRINHYIKNAVLNIHVQKQKKREKEETFINLIVLMFIFIFIFITTMKRNKEIKLSKQLSNGKSNV